jgi:chromosome segregation ATPase
MATSIMKSLALTFGGAIALGVGIKIGQTAGPSRIQEAEPSNDLALEPVLERLESMESRVVQAESALSQSTAPAEIAMPDIEFLHQHLVTYEQELKDLRNDLRTIDERSNQNLEEIGKTIGDLESNLPSLIDATAAPRFAQMEDRLRTEREETQARAIETLDDHLQTKVVQRISTLESDLAGQSAALHELRDCSLRTDLNMQKLLSGVERLTAEIGKRSASFAPPSHDCDQTAVAEGSFAA